MKAISVTLRNIERIGPRSRPIVGLIRPSFISVFIALSACNDNQDPLKPNEQDEPIPCIAASSKCSQSVQLGEQSFLPILRTHPLNKEDRQIRVSTIDIHLNKTNSPNISKNVKELTEQPPAKAGRL